MRKLNKNGLSKASQEVSSRKEELNTEFDIEKPLPTPFVPESSHLVFESLMRKKQQEALELEVRKQQQKQMLEEYVKR